MVIEIEAWPSASLTTFGCTPDSSNRVAKAYLRSWNRTSPSPIPSAHLLNRWDTDTAEASALRHPGRISLVNPGRRTQATLGLRSPMGAKVLRDELRHRPPTAQTWARSGRSGRSWERTRMWRCSRSTSCPRTAGASPSRSPHPTHRIVGPSGIEPPNPSQDLSRSSAVGIRNAERLGLGARTEVQGFVWRTPA